MSKYGFLVEVSKLLSQEEVLLVSNSYVLSKFNVVALSFSLIYLSNDPNTLSDTEFVVGAAATSFLNSSDGL